MSFNIKIIQGSLMSEDYCGDEELLASFDILKKMVMDGVFDEAMKQDIYEAIDCYIKQDFQVTNDMLKYLFTGWYVHSNLQNKPKDVNMNRQ